jgi:hypothetical protein
MSKCTPQHNNKIKIAKIYAERKKNYLNYHYIC